ncbi:hypothetical protein, partial [Acetobacterium bakii]
SGEIVSCEAGSEAHGSFVITYIFFKFRFLKIFSFRGFRDIIKIESSFGNDFATIKQNPYKAGFYFF